jgi:hypothetical protein
MKGRIIDAPVRKAMWRRIMKGRISDAPVRKAMWRREIEGAHQ